MSLVMISVCVSVAISVGAPRWSGCFAGFHFPSECSCSLHPPPHLTPLHLRSCSCAVARCMHPASCMRRALHPMCPCAQFNELSCDGTAPPTPTQPTFTRTSDDRNYAQWPDLFLRVDHATAYTQCSAECAARRTDNCMAFSTNYDYAASMDVWCDLYFNAVPSTLCVRTDTGFYCSTPSLGSGAIQVNTPVKPACMLSWFCLRLSACLCVREDTSLFWVRISISIVVASGHRH